MKKVLSILLMVLMVFFISGCTRQQTLSPEAYEVEARNLSNDALIKEYYQVDAELQGALDQLWEYQLEQAQKRSGPEQLGRGLGILIFGTPVPKVKNLRIKIAILLTLIHQRGLTLPK